MTGRVCADPEGAEVDGRTSCSACELCAEAFAQIAEIKAALERLAPGIMDGSSAAPLPSLLEALHEATAGDWFTSGEVMKRAKTDLDLRDALSAEHIRDATALGLWLARHEGQGVQRSKRSGQGTLWQVILPTPEGFTRFTHRLAD